MTRAVEDDATQHPCRDCGAACQIPVPAFQLSKHRSHSQTQAYNDPCRIPYPYHHPSVPHISNMAILKGPGAAKSYDGA